MRRFVSLDASALRIEKLTSKAAGRRFYSCRGANRNAQASDDVLTSSAQSRMRRERLASKKP